MAITTPQLLELYLAYFGRPPDVGGVQFYSSGKHALEDVVRGFSASPESVALHGSTFGAAQINAIYQNLFNRDAEPAGQLYWQQEVNAGRISPAQVALAILNGAQNADKTAVLNKLALARAFLEQLDTVAEIAGYAGANPAAAARSFLQTVDASEASLATALAALQAKLILITGAGQTLPVAPPATPAPTFAVSKDGGNIVSFSAAGAQIDVTEAGGGSFTFTSGGASGSAIAPITGIAVPVGTTLNISSTLATGKAFSGAGTALVIANATGEDLTAFNATGVSGLQLNTGQSYTLTAAQAAIARIGAGGVIGTLTDAGTTTVRDTLAALGNGVATALKAAGADSVIASAATGADISAITVAGIDGITLASGQNYTMTAAQAALATAAPGAQAVTLTTVASGTLNTNIESFVLGNFANNVTLGAAAQNISSAAGTATTLNLGGSTATGTYALANAADVLVATDGANIAAATTTSVELLTLAGAITMTAAQYSAFNSGGITAGGASDRIILTTALTGGEVLNAAVEKFTLAATNNSATLGAAQSINAQALAAGQTLALSGAFTASVTLTAGNLEAGSTGSTTVMGGTGDNTISLGSGNDTVDAGGGADIITGGDGIDTLNGQSGDDSFLYASMAQFLPSYRGVDQIDGGADNDAVVINFDNVRIDRSSDLQRMTNVEQLKAQSQSTARRVHDIAVNSEVKLGSLTTIDLSGDTANNSSGAFDLRDVTRDMTLKGVGTGTNSFICGSGADTLVGGNSTDVFYYLNAGSFISGNAVVDRLDGGGGNDSIVVDDSFSIGSAQSLARITNIEILRTLSQNMVVHNYSLTFQADANLGSISKIELASDQASGSTATVDLSGLTRGMTVTGVAKGSNTITGGSGADSLTGGEVTSILRGGGGNDSIATSTSGATTYVFEASGSANGVDTLTGVRTNGTFSFSAFLGTSSLNNAAVDSTLIGSALVLTGGLNIGVRYGSATLTAANILAAADGGVAGEVVVANGGKAVVFSFSETTAGSSANGSIYYVEDTTGARDFAVTLVGTMTGSAATITDMASAVGYL